MIPRRNFLATLGLMPLLAKLSPKRYAAYAKKTASAAQACVGISLVAGSGVERGQVVYLGADGKVYPFGVVSATNLDNWFDGYTKSKATEGSQVEVLVYDYTA